MGQLIKIKLPKNFNKQFDSNTEQFSPFDNFYLWIAKKFEDEDEKYIREIRKLLKIKPSKNELKYINPKSIKIHPADMERLQNLVEEWLIRIILLRDKQLKKEYHWLHFQYAPTQLTEKELEFFKEGYILVNLDNFFIKSIDI